MKAVFTGVQRESGVTERLAGGFFHGANRLTQVPAPAQGPIWQFGDVRAASTACAEFLRQSWQFAAGGKQGRRDFLLNVAGAVSARADLGAGIEAELAAAERGEIGFGGAALEIHFEIVGREIGRRFSGEKRGQLASEIF